MVHRPSIPIFQAKDEVLRDQLASVMSHLAASLRVVAHLIEPFMNGIYPYVYHSEKQLEAMRAAGVAHEEFSIYSITYPLVKRLLEDKE